MKKKIKDCSFKEFINNKSCEEEDIPTMYPLLAILRNYNRTTYSDNFKESQWHWLKNNQLKDEFLEYEIEVEDNVKSN